MAKKLSFFPTLRAAHPLTRFLHFGYCYTRSYGIVHSFAFPDSYREGSGRASIGKQILHF